MKLLVPLPFDVADLAHGRNLRVVNMIRELCVQADITVLVPDPARGESLRAHVPVNISLVGERADCNEDAKIANWNGRALDYFDAAPRLARFIPQVVDTYDAVLGFDLSSAAALFAAKTSSPRTVVVADLIDDPWLTWRSSSSQEQFTKTGLFTALALRQVRKRLLQEMNTVVTAGERDGDSLRSCGWGRVEVIPNGVEVEGLDRTQALREPLVVMTGFMSFPPNERAALFLIKQIWPCIRAELEQYGITDARVAIVGAEPTPRIQQAAPAAGVIVTGRVGSIRDWLLRARVAIAPMQSGSGIKNKILEACACGCPVVTTPLGAAGLPAGEKHGILTANTAEALAQTCVDLLRSPPRAAAIGEAGRRTMNDAFAWSALAARLLAVVQQQVAEKASSTRNEQQSEAMFAALPKEEALIDALS